MSSAFRRCRRVLPLLFWVAPAAVWAQDPPVRDTVPPVRDTVPAVAPEVQDTATPRPLYSFPAMPAAPAAGFAGAEWVWDREALLREAPVSLLDLLERLPGIAPVRGGVFAQPEAAAALGMTASRVEIEVDGFVLDPLAASSIDLSRIPLGQLREVRVQRRLGLLRIRMLTEQPSTEQPYTRIEAGIGEPTGNLFRGVFLAPHVIVGPLGGAMERLDTDGANRNEPADVFSGWVKWAWTRPTRGVQLEWQRTTQRRQPEAPWLTDRANQNIVLRARNAFTPDLVAEVYAGRASFDEEVADTTTGSAATDRLERESVQAGVRAVYQAPWAVLGAALRYRDGEFLPATEAVLDAAVSYGPARAGAEFGRASWRDADATTYTSLHVEVGPFAGAGVFAEITRGRRGAPVYPGPVPVTQEPEPDPEEPEPLPTPLPVIPQQVVTERDGWRAGLQLDLGSRASGRIAFIRLDQDLAVPFGLPFDSGRGRLAPTTLNGIEAYGRLVIVPDLLAVESWITDWADPVGWLYVPVRSWRTALELHTVPLPSGNLEIVGRFEGAQRGAMIVHDTDRAAELPLIVLPAATTFSAYLQIRVIDVRAFLRWEDLLGANAEGLPGRVLRGPRIFYGVKWNLWN